MSDKMKVILDCDTGSDDAVAIMMAILSPKIDLLGVSTVAGNKEIGFTTDNTLRVVDMLRSSTPVYRGCATSMVASCWKGAIPCCGRSFWQSPCPGSCWPAFIC